MTQSTRGMDEKNRSSNAVLVSTESAMTKNDRMIVYMDLLYTLVEIFLTILTAGSMALALYPQYPLHGVSPRTLSLCVWSDFFITTIFIVDVLTRFIVRDRKAFPTLSGFLWNNWYDIPALLTDIPLTFVQLPDLLGLLKGFRVIRLYRRFTQQTMFVSIMVKKPFLYLTVFVCCIIAMCAVLIKILEQEDNEEYRDFVNVMWFSVVTVTTVGYGEMNTPKTLLGRVLTLALMLTGIGLVSTLSAFTVAKIITIGKTEEKKQAMKEQLRQRWNLMTDGLFHIAEPYNPIANVHILRNNDRHRNSRLLSNLDDFEAELQLKSRNVSKLHKSSTLNVMVGMNTEIELPVDKVMQGAGGKFTVNTISSQAELIRSVAKEFEQRMLLEVVQSQEAQNDLTPRTRVHFALRKFQLHTNITNFLEMVEELSDIIFEPPRPHGLFMQKVYSMLHAIRKSSEDNALDFVNFEYMDPIDRKMSLVDEHFERYGVHHRVDYNEIMTEIKKIIVLYDRVNVVQWCVENLEYKPHITPASPVLEEVVPPEARMPTTEVIINNSLGLQEIYMMEGKKGREKVQSLGNSIYRRKSKQKSPS